MEKLNLLPCPFCGGHPAHYTPDPVLHEESSVRCQQCGVVVVAGGAGSQGFYDVVGDWNRRAAPAMEVRDWSSLPKTPEVRAVIQAYTLEVNRRAEENMLKTGKLEGSHYAAMRQVNKELGI